MANTKKSKAKTTKEQAKETEKILKGSGAQSSAPSGTSAAATSKTGSAEKRGPVIMLPTATTTLPTAGNARQNAVSRKMQDYLQTVEDGKLRKTQREKVSRDRESFLSSMPGSQQAETGRSKVSQGMQDFLSGLDRRSVEEIQGSFGGGGGSFDTVNRKNAGTGDNRKLTKTPVTTPSGYYDRPDFNTSRLETYSRQADGWGKKLEEIGGQRTQRQRELEGMAAEIRWLQQEQIPALQKAAQEAGSLAEIMAVKNQADRASARLDALLASYTTGRQELEGIDARYGQVLESYNTAVSGFEAEYAQYRQGQDEWRKTVRTDRDAIQKDLDAATAELQEATRNRTIIENRLNALSMEQVTPETAAERAALEAQLREAQRAERKAQEQERLLRDERDYSTYFNFESYRERADFAEKSKFRADVEDRAYRIANKDSETMENAKMLSSGNVSGLSDKETVLQQMTDDEVAMYNYLYATDPEKAQEYIDWLTRSLNARNRRAEEEKLTEFAKSSPWARMAMSAASVPARFFGAPISFVGQTIDYLKDGEIDQNAPYNSGAYIPTAITGAVAKEVEKKWGKPGSYTYQTAMSLANFTFAAAMTGNLFGGMGNATARAVAKHASLALMASDVAADTVVRMKDRGLSDEQSYSLGVIAGAAEYFSEMVSLETLLDKTSMGENYGGYILKNFIAEGSEEVVSDFINLFAEVMIAQDESEWRQKIEEYRRTGMSRNAAFGKAFADQLGEMGLSFLGGAISGGIMGGAAVVIDMADTQHYGAALNETESEIRADAIKGLQDGQQAPTVMELDGVTRGLIETGLSAQQGTEARDYAEAMLEKAKNGEKITNYEMGRMARLNERAEANGDLQEESEYRARQEQERRRAARLGANEYAAGETAEETNRAQADLIPARDEAGGVVLPTAETQRTVLPTAEYSNNQAENLNTAQSSNRQVNQEVLQNGAEQRTETQAAAEQRAEPAAEQDGRIVLPGGERAGDVSDRDGGWVHGTSTRGQVGVLAEGTEGARERSADAYRAARERNSLGKNVRSERVNVRETLGVRTAAEYAMVQVIAEDDLPEHLKQIADNNYKQTGMPTVFTLNPIQLENGALVNAVITADKIIVQANHTRYSPEQLNDHELMHDFIREDPGLKSAIRDAIQENYDITKYDDAIDKYMEKHRGVYESQLTNLTPEEAAQRLADMAEEELICDAYAGMNKFAQHAERYQETVRGTYAERTGPVRQSRQNAAAMERTNGPGETYSLEEIDGRIMPVIDTENDTRDYRVAAAYLKTLINEKRPFATILRDAQPVYAGMDLPGEYSYSGYSKEMSSALRQVKMQAATNLDEMLLLAENGEWRENVEEKHDLDALNGWYRYETEFAVPIKDLRNEIDHYTIYGGTLLIRNDADGKSYLYDLLDVEIKKGRASGLLPSLHQSSPVAAARQELPENPVSVRHPAPYTGNAPAPYATSKVAEETQKVNSEFGETGAGAVKAEDTDGYSEMYSLETWIAPGERETVAQELIDEGFDEATVRKWIEDVNGIAAVIAGDRTRLDFEAADNQTFIKPNSEYQYTADASTLCDKRRLYQGTFNEIQHRLRDEVLTSDDLIGLMNMMKEMGYAAPCSVCYVESRRRNLGRYAQRWLDSYQGNYVPHLDEVTTTDGLERLRHEHPQTYQDFVKAMKKIGVTNPKVVELRTSYRGEIRKFSKKTVDSLNRNGGMRLQSFSDFETPHLLDMMQVVMDLSAKGLSSQAYTKVPNFAWVFGDTGIKINLSLIAEGDGLNPDGTLRFSNTEGMDFDEALRLRDAYPENVGTILVGVNDAHILAAMADDRIDFIIPFHKSGWGENELRAMGMDAYEDYTSEQNERDITTGKTPKEGNIPALDYWDFSKSGRENAETYLRLCAEQGKIPKFSRFLVNNGDGSYSLQPDGSTDGYWKTLTDFRMYDNEGRGAPQRAVRPDFNLEEAQRVLTEYEGGADTLPVAQDVVDRFLRERNATAPERMLPGGETTRERFSVEDEAPKRARRRSAQEKRDAGEKLTEKEFYALYSAHKLNLRGEKNLQEQIDNIILEGFKGMGGFGANLMPTRQSVSYRGVNNYNILLEMEQKGELPEGYADNYKAELGEEFGKPVPENLSVAKYGPREGETILLVPKSGAEINSKRGLDRVRPGYKPSFRYEIVQAEYDHQPYYEMYSKAYDEYAGTGQERFSVEDEEYMRAVEDGNEHYQEVLVRNAAKEAGAALGDDGRPIDLYHGTGRFGFTEFDTDQGTDSKGMIYATTRREVAANYAGRNHYAGTRSIGRRFIEDATDLNDIIRNARDVYGSTYTVMTEQQKAARRAELERQATEIADRINALEDHSDLYQWDDEYYTVTNAIASLEDLFFTIETGVSEWFEAEEYAEYLESVVERFERNLQTTREYLNEHREELFAKESTKEAYRLLTGYDLFDAYVDIKYNYLPLLSGKDLIVNEAGNINDPQKLQEAMDQIHEIGAYHLYGFLGDNPLEIDAGNRDWLAIEAHDITDDETWHSTDYIAKKAREKGYSSVVIRNVYDGGILADDYIFFDKRQVKSADPVTYDDDGNVIPLSQRFSDRTDLRYSVEDDSTVAERFMAWSRENPNATSQEAGAELRRIEREQQRESRKAKPQETEKPPKLTKPPQESRPIIAKRELRQSLERIFSIPSGMKKSTGDFIDQYADKLLKKGSMTMEDREKFFNHMYETGVVEETVNDAATYGRSLLKGRKFYVNDTVREELGDDWNEWRKRAMAAGFWLTNDQSDPGLDMANQELSEIMPGLFNPDDTDLTNMLQTFVQVAEEGKAEQMPLAEYVASIAEREYVSEDDVIRDYQQQMERELDKFAEKANLEVYLRDRTGIKIAEERAKYQEALAREREKYRTRRAMEQADRQAAMEQARERRDLREMQQRTLRTLKQLKKMRNKTAPELQPMIDQVLGDLDLYAIGAANELRYSKRYDATWGDIAEMYAAYKQDEDFIPNADLERIMQRVMAPKIGDMTVEDLQDRYNAAVGLLQNIYNRNRLLADEYGALISEVTNNAAEDIRNAPIKGGEETTLGKIFNTMQLTPMNMLERMAGWNPDSDWMQLARKLEDGERKRRKYIADSQGYLADEFVRDNADWVKKADGQGRDAIWYQYDAPEITGWNEGNKPIFSDKKITVWFTPAQKVHMALESKNIDNLRHMMGGRTFPNKELYSKGKTQEAFAQGTTVKLDPATVRAMVSSLTPEEQALYDALEPFYNQMQKVPINETSMILNGYEKATEANYAPIFTNKNYTKSEPGIFDMTAEGIGSLKERVVSFNPSYQISAFDAFDRSVKQAALYIGMAIPVRDMNAVLNKRTAGGESMKDVITHKWSNKQLAEVEDLLTELQGGRQTDIGSIEKMTNSLLNKYISATFGFNPSIVLKQSASFPLAGAYLGMRNMPNLAKALRVSDELINTYTGELAYRTLGYATPETAELKKNPNRLQQSGTVGNFIFGGGAITWMDGVTVKTMWSWAENKVRREQPDLDIGTQEEIDSGSSPFYQAVAREFNEAVSRSQPMYDTMHRAEIMREGGALNRTFTLFKTVPMQEYNMIRQAIGEAQYYKKTGADSKTQRAAARKVGSVYLSIATGNLMIGAITLANALLKNKAKKYRDDDDELTTESVMLQFARQWLQDGAGIMLFGDTAAEIIGNILTGDKWYGLETPGIGQLTSILEQTIKAGSQVKQLIIDGLEMAKDGGNFLEYLKDNYQVYLKAAEDVARTVGTYATGLPIDNLRAYLLGAIKWISPEINVAYEDAVSKAKKAGLSGLTGQALEMRMESVLEQRLGDLGDVDENIVQELSRLYEAGYPNAVPSAEPEKISINGEEHELSIAQQQQYGRIWSQAIGDSLKELVGSVEYQQADEETRAAALKVLYAYGHEQAKEALFPEYKPETSAADRAMAAGATLAEWAMWSKTIADMDTSEKYEALLESGYDDDTKIGLIGGMMQSTEEKTDAGNLSAWGKMQSILDSGLDVDQYIELKNAGAISAYMKNVENGLNAKLAYNAAMAIKGMDPEGDTGKAAKWRLMLETSGDQDEQIQALSTVMYDSEFEKLQLADSFGFAPEVSVILYETLPSYDLDGNGSYKQDEYEAAIDAMSGGDTGGIMLPGGNTVQLTNEERAALWQIWTGSKSAKNNPYDTDVGQAVIDARAG